MRTWWGLFLIVASLNFVDAEVWREDFSYVVNSATAGDELGAAMAAHGDVLAVGAPGKFGGRGRVLVFQRDTGGNGRWGQVKELQLTGTIASTSDAFGSSVAVWKDLIAVGVPGRSGGGAVQIFGRNEGGSDNWGLLAQKNSLANGVRFGSAVALSGDYLFVGDPGRNSSTGTIGAGQVFTFLRNATGVDVWSERTTIDSPSGLIRGGFGTSIAMEREQAVVGEPSLEFGGVGRAHVYVLDIAPSPHWDLSDTLEEGSSGDGFGAAVSISGTVIAVGAPTTGNDDWGQAYIFERNRLNEWLLEKTASLGTAKSYRFGQSLAAWGSQVAIGAPGTGLIQFYSRHTGSSSWSPTAQLSVQTRGNGVESGAAMALEGESLFVGSPGAETIDGVASGQLNLVRQSPIGELGFVAEAVDPDDVILDGLVATKGIEGTIEMHGDYLAVQVDLREAAPAGGGDNYGLGVALYHREGVGNSQNWVLKKLIPRPGPQQSSTFGNIMRLVGDDLIVGEIYRFTNQSVGIFHFNRNQGGIDNWGLVTSLSTGFNNRLSSFDFDGEHLVAGTIEFGTNNAVESPFTLQEEAWVWRRTPGVGNGWSSAHQLEVEIASLPSGTRPFRFGNSVAVCGDHLVVGAPLYGTVFSDGTMEGHGAAFVFQRNQGGADQWGEVARIFGGGQVPGLGGTVEIEGGEIAVTSSLAPGPNNIPEGKVLLCDFSQVNSAGEITDIRILERNPSLAFNHQGFGYRLRYSEGRLLVGTILRTSPLRRQSFLYERVPGALGDELDYLDFFERDFVTLDRRRIAYGYIVSGQFFDRTATRVLEALDDETILKDYSWWAEENFPDEHPVPSQEASVWGKEANPDGDDLSNIEEAFFAENPTMKSPEVLTIGCLTPPQTGKSLLSFRQDTGLVGIKGTLRRSFDLEIWSSFSSLGEVNRQGVELGGGLFQWALEVDHPITRNAGFFRIEVECE